MNQKTKDKAYWNMLRVLEHIQVWCHQQPTPRTMTPVQRVASRPPFPLGEYYSKSIEIIDGRKFTVYKPKKPDSD